MSERRSVTIVTPTFAPETFGTPLYTTDLALWLRDAGWGVQVVTAQPYYPEFRRHPGYGRRTRESTFEDIPIHRLPTIVPKPYSAWRRATTDLNFALQGWSRGRFGRIPATDHVISVSAGTPLAAAVGRQLVRPGGVHLAYVHDVLTGLASGSGLTHASRTTSLVRRLEVRALGHADVIATLSEEMRDTLVGLGVPADRVQVSELWATVEAPIDPARGGTDLLYSGSLGLKHGLGALLDVLTILLESAPEITTTITGAGPQHDAVEAKVEERGLPVTFEPPVCEVDLGPHLARSPIHLIAQLPGAATSVLPSKVINSLAVGAVVFAMTPSDSALAHLARECDAVVIAPPDDPGRAAEILLELLAERPLTEKRATASAFACEHYRRDRRIAALVSLLTDHPPAIVRDTGPTR